ncbi:hypothetical protein BBJ28_00013213 [Nothophytophthora sp. Chile5]|nr:hypothetical protein BBJ28_00013213 [Nothophytophthora sp. Chile5]
MGSDPLNVICRTRTAIKKQPWIKDPAARRQATLALQRQARRDLADHARQLAQSDEPPSRAVRAREDADEEAVGDAAPKRKTREDRVKQRREHFSKQLMVPEWLIDVPRDLNGNGSALGEGWYVLPRPEGKRCLVVANGKSLAIGKGYLLYNCTTEFRLYWLRDKLSEGAAATVTPANPFRFLVREACTRIKRHRSCSCPSVPDALFPFLYAISLCRAAHSVLRKRPRGHFGGVLHHLPLPQVRASYRPDGLLFYMKAGHYDLGLSPLALVWKDANTSRFFVYTTKPSIVLRLEGSNVFATLEGIVLFTAAPDFLQQHEVHNMYLRIHLLCGQLTNSNLLCLPRTPAS